MTLISSMPDFALFVLRITFGFLTFMHGFGKLGHMKGFADYWSMPIALAWAVCLIQLAGGALIFIGFQTQMAAIVQLGLNLVIVYMLITRSKEPFLAPAQHSWSIGLIYAVMPLVLIIGGGGAFSVDMVRF